MSVLETSNDFALLKEKLSPERSSDRKKALEVLDGLMFGDGSLIRYPHTAGYRMSASKPPITIDDHLKYECWLRDNVFTVLNIEATARVYWGTYSHEARKGEKFQYAYLWTENTPLLVPIYDEWYSGGRWVAHKGCERYPGGRHLRDATRVVPERLLNASIIPPRSLTHWFIGDGGSRWAHLERLAPTPEITFATYGFAKDEVYHLMSMLNNVGIRTSKPSKHSCKRGAGLRIILAQRSVNDFMDLIEPHIMEIFGDSKGSSYKDLLKRRKS